MIIVLLCPKCGSTSLDGIKVKGNRFFKCRDCSYNNEYELGYDDLIFREFYDIDDLKEFIRRG